MRFFFLSFLFIIVCSKQVFSQDYSQLRKKLEVIADSSLLLRKNVMPVIREFGPQSAEMDSLNTLILRYDSTSLTEVEKILDAHGWLGKSQIGEKANLALFITIQHASSNQVRERYFPMLEKSALAGESELANMATMKDRILVEKGEKQLYGTQYKLENRKRVLLPVADKKNLKKRRKMVGLPAR